MSHAEQWMPLRRPFLASLILHALFGAWVLSSILAASSQPRPVRLDVVLAPTPRIAEAARQETATPQVQKQPRQQVPNLPTRPAASDRTSPNIAAPANAGQSVPESGTPNASAAMSSPPEFNAAYLNNPTPAYPATARRRRQQGTTLLDVRVGADGRPLAVTVRNSSGVAEFDEAARAAVQSWTFAPAKKGDKSVDGSVEVPIRFRLND